MFALPAIYYLSLHITLPAIYYLSLHITLPAIYYLSLRITLLCICDMLLVRRKLTSNQKLTCGT